MTGFPIIERLERAYRRRELSLERIELDRVEYAAYLQELKDWGGGREHQPPPVYFAGIPVVEVAP